jgi:hypothetical protein
MLVVDLFVKDRDLDYIDELIKQLLTLAVQFATTLNTLKCHILNHDLYTQYYMVKDSPLKVFFSGGEVRFFHQGKKTTITPNDYLLLEWYLFALESGVPGIVEAMHIERINKIIAKLDSQTKFNISLIKSRYDQYLRRLMSSLESPSDTSEEEVEENSNIPTPMSAIMQNVNVTQQTMPAVSNTSLRFFNKPQNTPVISVEKAHDLLIESLNKILEQINDYPTMDKSILVILSVAHILWGYYDNNDNSLQNNFITNLHQQVESFIDNHLKQTSSRTYSRSFE